MKEVQDGVWSLQLFGENVINCYLVGDVLIDAATRLSARPILRQAGDRIGKVALTHVHPDHQGAAHAICAAVGVPLACPESEVARMEGREPWVRSHPYTRITNLLWTGPPHRVAQALREGDQLAGFTVLDMPGHTRGHVVYWRESDRVAIVGDLVANMNIVTGRRGLQELPRFVTENPGQCRESIRRLASLRPRVVLPGHGGPITDPGVLQAFAGSLS